MNKERLMNKRKVAIGIVATVTFAMTIPTFCQISDFDPNKNEPTHDVPLEVVEARIHMAVSLLVDQCYPNLKTADLRLKAFEERETFFDTKLESGEVFQGPDRRYTLRFNRVAFDAGITDRALTAILAHELSHISDYQNMNGWQLIGLGLKYSLSSRFRVKYERATDERALTLGFALGLKEYRRWVYRLLNPKELKKKKLVYFTPEQIDDWVSHHQTDSCIANQFLADGSK